MILFKVLISMILGFYLGYVLRKGDKHIPVLSRAISLMIIIGISVASYYYKWWWGIPFFLSSMLSALINWKKEEFEMKKGFVHKTLMKKQEEREKENIEKLYSKLSTPPKKHPKGWKQSDVVYREEK